MPCFVNYLLGKSVEGRINAVAFLDLTTGGEGLTVDGQELADGHGVYSWYIVDIIKRCV